MKEFFTGCFFAYVLLKEVMSTKFIFGFLAGTYVSTQYDLKPYIDMAEEKIKNQLENKPPEKFLREKINNFLSKEETKKD